MSCLINICWFVKQITLISFVNFVASPLSFSFYNQLHYHFSWILLSLGKNSKNYKRQFCDYYYTPRTTKLLGGILVSLRPSVRPFVRPSVRPSVRLSRLPCPLCNIYSSGWILSILATNDHYHERMCRTQWPLTLTYIFKVIRPWLRKSCPLCSVYSSG